MTNTVSMPAFEFKNDRTPPAKQLKDLVRHIHAHGATSLKMMGGERPVAMLDRRLVRCVDSPVSLDTMKAFHDELFQGTPAETEGLFVQRLVTEDDKCQPFTVCASSVAVFGEDENNLSIALFFEGSQPPSTDLAETITRPWH